MGGLESKFCQGEESLGEPSYLLKKFEDQNIKPHWIKNKIILKWYRDFIKTLYKG